MRCHVEQVLDLEEFVVEKLTEDKARRISQLIS